MLPSRGSKKLENGMLDGRYAGEAMQLFMSELKKSKTEPTEDQVKMFGGGSMFPDAKLNPNASDVCSENIEAGRLLLKKTGFRLNVEDVGGTGHRQLIYDLWSGNVWVRQQKEVLSRL